MPHDQIPPRMTSSVPGHNKSLRYLLQEAIRILSAETTLDENHVTRMRALSERLREGRFHLAVLGQFKRGKSTFVNALLGAPVLPTAVVPLTALPTFVRWGETPRAEVRFQDGRPPETSSAQPDQCLETFLQPFVTEDGNPKNRKGIQQVDVWYPASILREGLVIIDTPGIGSTFRHNTEATLNFLPQCDACLFLVSADPPMTEVEVDFLRQVQKRISRVLFVLNKVDYLEAEDRSMAISFLRRTLDEHLGFGSGVSILAVSSRQGLLAAQQRDDPAWETSGLAQVQRILLDFIAHEKARTLEDSVARKASETLEEALLQIQLTIQSLKLPIKDLEARLAIFEQKIHDLEQERILAADLLTGGRKRAHAFLEEQSEALREKARTHFQDLVRLKLDQQECSTEADLQEALEAIIPSFFERELGTISALFQERTEALLREHQERSDRHLDALRRVAAELFEIPYRAPASSGAFELRRDPYWVSRQWTDALSPIKAVWVDRLLPESARRRRILARIQEQVRMLVIRNVENLRWALYQSLDQSIQQFSAQLDERLTNTIQATLRGITVVLDKRRDTECNASKELGRFEIAGERIAALVDALDEISISIGADNS